MTKVTEADKAAACAYLSEIAQLRGTDAVTEIRDDHPAVLFAARQREAYDWQPIGTCPENTVVIGLKKWPDNDDTGVICGTLYDLRPNCIFDLRRGRWIECTHWKLPPEEENDKP